VPVVPPAIVTPPPLALPVLAAQVTVMVYPDRVALMKLALVLMLMLESPTFVVNVTVWLPPVAGKVRLVELSVIKSVPQANEPWKIIPTTKSNRSNWILIVCCF
jgi:hypothetical protein